MAYKIHAAGAVRRDLKKLPKAVAQEIGAVHFPAIKTDPFGTKTLKGPFKGLRSYHFSYAGTDYRIVYEIYEEDGILLILLIGKREGFYQVLRRRIG